MLRKILANDACSPKTKDKDMSFKAILAFLFTIFIWNPVYSAAQSSMSQLVAVSDSILQIQQGVGQAAEIFGEEDQSVKHQRTVRSSESSCESFAQLFDRMDAMDEKIAQLQGLAARNIDAIKQLSKHTILCMASAATFDVMTVQQIAILHMQKLFELAVSEDDEEIQHICLIMAERFAGELKKIPVPSRDERTSFIMCANVWLNKVEYPKLPAKFHAPYLGLVQKLRPSTSWSVIGHTYGLI